MLAYALRRILWAVPTLIGISIVVFLLTSLLPDPLANLDGFASSEPSYDALYEAHRAHFLDLPRFFNSLPKDSRAKVEDCIEHIEKRDAFEAVSLRRLPVFGGAAFPTLLPRLGTLSADSRRKIAMAIAPVAVRMGDGRAFADAPDKVKYWSDFWADHAIDFTDPAAHRVVSRLIAHGGPDREADIARLDTFALPTLFETMESNTRRDVLASVFGLISSMTNQDHTWKELGSNEQLARTRSFWRSWWFIHQSDFVSTTGPERVFASLTETRYARWVTGAIRGRLLRGDGARVVGDVFVARASVTVILTFLALLISLGCAIPLGVIAARLQNRRGDAALTFFLIALTSVPVFVLAQALVTKSGSQASAFFPLLTLVLVSVGGLSRTQRTAMIEILSQDFIRTARAKGVEPIRLFLVHALRTAVLPMVSVAGVQLPFLIGASFVVEEVFALHGLGWETLRALRSHDIAWVVATTLFVAVLSALSLVGSDVVSGILDPRVREQLRRSGRA